MSALALIYTQGRERTSNDLRSFMYSMETQAVFAECSGTVRSVVNDQSASSLDSGGSLLAVMCPDHAPGLTFMVFFFISLS